MAVAEIALVTRARGLATHLLPRSALEMLAEADDVEALARALSRLGARIDPLTVAPDAGAIEGAAERMANRHRSMLYRWQERAPGVLEVFDAHQDRRSLRALLRGAVQGAPPSARLEGLLPTPSLPPRVLDTLACQASPASVVQQLVRLAHPDAVRLAPLVAPSQPDLLAVDLALLRGFADRAVRAAGRADEPVREFVSAVIDVGNAQTALLVAGEPRDVAAADLFVAGGRWLPVAVFAAAVAAGSPQRALTALEPALARSPLAGSPKTASDAIDLDRHLLVAALARLTRMSRLEPLGSAPLLRVLLLIEAQTRDLRAAAWGAALGTPTTLRKQQLVTPP